MTTTPAAAAVQPTVGMGATIYAGSDAYPATVSRVSPSGKTIWVRKDEHMVVSGTWEAGNVDYVTYPNPDADERQYTLRSNGRWMAKGTPVNARYGHLSLGARHYAQDPSF
jgi:hypothetical protein